MTAPATRGSVCVVIAAEGERSLATCLSSVRSHTAPEVPVLSVEASAAAVDGAIASCAPADVIVLSEPCRVSAGWLGRLRDAARADTNTATASALTSRGGPLALYDGECSEPLLDDLAEQVARRSSRLRPRLQRAVGPCVYVRREAFELVGSLDEQLELGPALEVDFAVRCLISGLTHVAVDDVVVGRLKAPAVREPQSTVALRERYPYLDAAAGVADSGVLGQALEAARGERARLSVTIDARALDGAVTGTQVHIIELIRALARTGALRLRLLVREERIDRETLALLRALPDTELLDEASVDDATLPSAVMHRPQQAFAAEDVAIALRLGERVVLSQLDLIGYRNPAYFAGAREWKAYRRASRHGMSAAERVVVFSEHTRAELLADALVEPERISVVAPGLDHTSPLRQQAPASMRAHEGGPFLLCLGTDFRHKNRLFALRLLRALREEHDWSGMLVLAGTHIPHGSSRDLERAFLDQHPELCEAVLELGPVSEQEKAWLIAHASALAYPSVYEGFGLVPFEAALAGVPCIFAAQSALAETLPADNATILPWDARQSAAAAHPLLVEPEARSRHVERLADVATGLTWAAAASATVEVYREALAAPVRAAATLSRDAVQRERELLAAHQVDVDTLIGEREMVLRDYDELLAELGPGRGLVGSEGALPEDLQHALLALAAHPSLGRPLYGGLARLFAAARALRRAFSTRSRDAG